MHRGLTVKIFVFLGGRRCEMKRKESLLLSTAGTKDFPVVFYSSGFDFKCLQLGIWQDGEHLWSRLDVNFGRNLLRSFRNFPVAEDELRDHAKWYHRTLIVIITSQTRRSSGKLLLSLQSSCWEKPQNFLLLYCCPCSNIPDSSWRPQAMVFMKQNSLSCSYSNSFIFFLLFGSCLKCVRGWVHE